MNYDEKIDVLHAGEQHLSAPPVLASKQRKAILAATLGTVVEFTDWLIYATFAPLFSAHFFPASDSRTSLLSAFAVFAVGFVMRPIGGAVLGAYADKHGRKKGLTLSVLLMAGSSLVIACCPGYGTIGFAAPLVLVLARFAQGFAAGGEFGSASTFLIESSAPAQRGFAGSWQHFAVNTGVLLAALIAAMLTSTIDAQSMKEWGWRIAFLVGGLLGLVALWVRRAAAETDAFKAAPKRKHHTEHPLRKILRDHRGDALRVLGIAMPGNLCVYLWLVVFPTLAHLKTGMPLREAFYANVISTLISLLVIPIFGKISDIVGRKPVLIMFAAGSAIHAWPALNYLTDDFWTATTIATIGMIFASGYAATCATIMAEQFPAVVRATGVGLPYAISVALFGGTLPYIVTSLSKAGLLQYLWVYITTICLVGLIIYVRMPETKGKMLG